MLGLLAFSTFVLGEGPPPPEWYCLSMDQEADPCRLNRRLLTLTLTLALSPARQVVRYPLYPGAVEEPAPSEQTTYDLHEAGRCIYPASGAFGG